MTTLSVAASRIVGRAASGDVDDLTAAQVKVILVQPINAQTGTSYTLVLADADYLVTLSNGSAITLTVPTNASVAFPVGTRVELAQLGAGQVTVAAAGGVTVNATPGLKIAAQYGRVVLQKYATNTWLLTGDTAA